MEHSPYTSEQKAQYDQDGYLNVWNFFNVGEIALLYQLATEDTILCNAFRGRGFKTI